MAAVTDLHVNLIGKRDLSGEIYRQLREAVREGRVRPGDRLPPTRDLARSLRVSRTHDRPEAGATKSPPGVESR
jgi:hypothetical protein